MINISNVAGWTGLAGQLYDGASQAGLWRLTRSMTREVAPLEFTVNLVAPG